MESPYALCPALWGFDADTWWIGLLGGLGVLVFLWVFRFALLVRFPLWVLRHTIYRVHVHGAENVPRTGGCLLVCNHVSHIDAGIVQAAQKRSIRFLIWAPFLGVPFLRWILKLTRVIPIDAASGPRAIIQSLRSAGEALAAGEVVAIFAEGGITRTGFLLPFQRGFEQIVKKTPVPIIPVCLDHVWGSIFSYQSGRFFWKWPRRLPCHVYVSFGEPLPPGTDAFQVRQAIQKLSAESGLRRNADRMPVHRRFVRQAVRHPFRSCLIDQNAPKKEMTYGEALVGAKILLRRLKPLLKDEKMVGVWLPPGTGASLVNIVLAFLGKVAVNLNYTSAPEIVRSANRQCGVRKVISSKLFALHRPLDPGEGVDMIYLEDFRKGVGKWERIRTFLGVLLLPGWLHDRWLLGLGKHKNSDLATVIFSSGSTGEPKGIMLTHGNIAANTESVIQAIDPDHKDRLLGILPFFHSFGYTVILWLPLQVGASTVFHPNPLAPREIGELCRKYRCTIFLSTPTFLRSFLKRCDAEDFRSLRLLVCGAERLPPALADEFQAKFGVRPLEGYGCTELSPVGAVSVPDWQQGSQRQLGTKVGSIGQPVPGVAARIVHRETGEVLGPGQEGILQMFGANVMKGYLGKEEMTREKIVDGGWYVTGDLAYLDEDGFITITGREERFAKVGGEMVPLEKVEEELHLVLESNERVLAVTAIPDGKRGERLIVLHLDLAGRTPAELSKKLQERGLPNLYIPGPRDFFPVEDLPVLGSGKLDLKKCRQQAEAVAGSDS